MLTLLSFPLNQWQLSAVLFSFVIYTLLSYVNQSLLTTVAHLLPFVTSPDTQGCCDITLAVNADNTICEHHFNKTKHKFF